MFCPGLYKPSGEYFSPADTRCFGDNFALYSANGNPALRPQLKIGHDRTQRYAKSFGFPSLGEVVEAHTEPDGTFVADRITGIPRIVGSAINSGFLKSGSIELPPKGAWRPPDDPNAKINGDVVSGIALLGEELPAVPGFPPPKAVFADGTPVPPLTDEEQVWWLEHMAKIANRPDDEHAAPSHGAGKRDGHDSPDEYAARSLCFSALTFEPHKQEQLMDAPAILAALQADPALLEAVMAGLAPPVDEAVADVAAEAVPAGETFSGSDEIRGKNQEGQKRAMWAKDPDGGPHDTYAAASGEEKDVDKKKDDAPAWFTAFAAETKKDIGALQAFASSLQSEKDAAQMSAFSAQVDRDIQANDLTNKVPPVSLPSVRKSMLDTLTAKTFASESGRKQAYDGIVRAYAALPVNPMLRDSVQDKEKAGSNLASLAASNPQLAGMLRSENLRRAYPESAPKIAEKFGVQLV